MKQRITIVGLGPGGEDELTLGALKAIKQGVNVILRTEKHGIALFLKEQGIEYSSLDDLYQNHDRFDDVYHAMVKRILEKAEEGEVVLGLPGHPLIGERLTFELLNKLDPKVYDVKIIPGISRAGALTALVGEGGPEGLKILMAPEMEGYHLDTRLVTVVLNIHSPLLASEVKLMLLRVYPPELDVCVSRQREEGGMEYHTVPLHEMDRLKDFDHTTCLYLPALELTDVQEYDFSHLVEIMEILRGPEGCPWDREQDHESLKQYLIEETYEVLEAIDQRDTDKILEELGDLMLQVVFHCQIAKEHGEFDIKDVTTRICRKMIERHTHIFGADKVNNADEVISNWEAIKKKEKGLQSYTQVLKDIPSNLPALMRGYKVQKKAALVGFDWNRVEEAMLKVDEELKELKDVYLKEDHDKITEELGDLLFAVVNVARFLKVEPELALTATINKFIQRFEYIEKMADRPLDEMSLEEMDNLWNQAKIAFSSQKDV